MKHWLIALLTTITFSGVLFAQGNVSTVKGNITGEKHLYGATLSPDELDGRIVIVWDGRNVVNQMLNDIRNYEENNNSNSWKPRVTEYSSYRECERQVEDFKRSVRSAQTDGRVLVVVAVPVPDNSRERKRYNRAIRQLQIPFSVYNFESGTIAYDSRGNQAVQGGSISEISRNAKLLDILEETPPYIKGRIFHYLTPEHEVLGKSMIEGRNIEKGYEQLKKEAEAGDDSAKTKEAVMMVATIEAYLSKRSSEIETALQSAPSLALERIAMFNRTAPTHAKKYARAFNALRRNNDVKKLAQVRNFLDEIAEGKYGPVDTVRYSQMRLRSLNPLLSSKNASIVAEANALKAILEGYCEE